MDRALDRRLLAGALEGLENLPTTDELRTMLADAEVEAFFAGEPDIGDRLLETAWNLHHVGTVRPALALYGRTRQVQANAVAAHIFDLALGRDDVQEGERLVLTFASQISYIRGDRTPNATAMGRRLLPPQPSLLTAPGRTSLELGCAFLTLDRRRTRNLLEAIRPQLDQYEQQLGQTANLDSPLAAAIGVARGIGLFQRYLGNGDSGDLDAARQQFLLGATARGSERDLDSRWVAANLLDLCDDLGGSSVWAVLPEGTPPAVARAMTLGDPPVLALWPPQISLLGHAALNPLRAEVRRAVLAFPTSAGKTLFTHLIIANHLATCESGVCVVAPSHSLCREIRQGLDGRLWLLRTRTEEDGPLGDLSSVRGRVVVMTPEKLAARLRADERQLLADFGLFVLDEAHLVGDESRGWTFETTIARLHQLTRETEHRLVLVSAALGGTATIHSWLDLEAPPVSDIAKWRGPRRLHATYVTQVKQGSRRTEPPQGRQRLPRTVEDLIGVVHLFVDQGKAVASRAAPLGTVTRAGTQRTRPSVAEQLRPVVLLAAMSGAVLTVHARKKTAEDLARSITEELPVREEAAGIRRLAEQRLGAAHPLVQMLDHGVAYHHAALPDDIQAEIESAVRSGALSVVCATTTLTDGLNLPVRTVIICDRGWPEGGDQFNLVINSADLLNAAGRAGRAGRETEGWIIVVREPYGPDPRDALKALDRDQPIRSSLATQVAFTELGAYEALLSETADLVLTDVPREVDSFLSYCWYLADAAELLEPGSAPTAVVEGVRATLAWHQLPEHVRSRWEALAGRVATQYQSMQEGQRRRWAKTGVPLSANAVLDQVATSALVDVEAMDDFDALDPLELLTTLLDGRRLELLLSLVPERQRRFKRKRYGRTELADVDIRALILDWLAGKDLVYLTERHLADVEPGPDESYRYEQLNGFLTSVCEHHLPWVLGIIMDWLNPAVLAILCDDLPAYLHFGVADPVALTLLKGGIRSRRLAVVVGNDALVAQVGLDDLRSWLIQLGPSEWRSRFQAGPGEVADLLLYLHDAAAGTSASLLEGGTAQVGVEMLSDEQIGDNLLVVDYATDSDGFPRVAAVDVDSAPVAFVAASAHQALATLLDAGFRLSGALAPGDRPSLLVRMDAE